MALSAVVRRYRSRSEAFAGGDASPTRNTKNLAIRLFMSCNRKGMTFGHFEAEPDPWHFGIRVGVSWDEIVVMTPWAPAATRKSFGAGSL